MLKLFAMIVEHPCLVFGAIASKRALLMMFGFFALIPVYLIWLYTLNQVIHSNGDDGGCGVR